jgi:hypothetical protein
VGGAIRIGKLLFTQEIIIYIGIGTSDADKPLTGTPFTPHIKTPGCISSWALALLSAITYM